LTKHLGIAIETGFRQDQIFLFARVNRTIERRAFQKSNDLGEVVYTYGVAFAPNVSGLRRRASSFIGRGNLIRRPGAAHVSRRQAGEACRTSAPATLKSVARVYTREELISQRERWRREGKMVVFTNGCYDLLHPGHIALLEQARSLGDALILALNSDAGVRLSKGRGRPLVPEAGRAALAAALEAVDAVTLFDEETPRALVAALLPDILVKGADWSHFIAGREEVEASGGKVVAIPLEPGYSTTNIVERILA
jgi:D-glycero-beta-D-manno-heptose 1-phosphate adenylyltransferase